MTAILLAHARRYPKLTPRDAVKLLYQSEFGGGHLIRDEEACLAFLRREYAATVQDPNIPLMEDIGNGMVRVNLAALDAHKYSPEALGRDFIRSAAVHLGSMDQFRKRLTLLTDLTQSGAMPFSPESLAAFLQEYEAAGCPPISHSDTYREAYRPAYRVLDRTYLPK